MSPHRLIVMTASWAAVYCSLSVFAPVGRSDIPQGLELFEKRIRPVLIQHCYECHSSAARELKGGLQLDSRDGIRRGGDTGPAVVPGNVSESLLIEALQHESLEMPPDSRLSDSIISDFVKWIQRGAPDPRDQPPGPDEVADLSWQLMLESRRDWWSLADVVEPSVPKSGDHFWSDHPIDRFIQVRHHDAGLMPARDAEPHVMLRRLSLILTGLPPTPMEVTEFESLMAVDPGNGYEILVEQMLESPHFGERWARHWMDVVRFAETHGYEWNHEIRDAWQYRDYLIRAFNDDIPFNQFVREHIAGDLLESPRINPELHINESVIGTAFWRFGELGHDNCVTFPEIRYDALDNQIDTLTKAFQATTVSCARCHDHKFDAVSTRDYYALVGVLESSRQVVQTIDTPDRIRDHVQQLRSLKKEIREQLADEWLRSLSNVDGLILDVLRPGLDTAVQTSAAALAHQLAGGEIEMEDPSSVLKRMTGIDTEKAVHTVWRETGAAYRKAQFDRAEFNARNFERWWSFDRENAYGWSAAGLGSHDQLSHAGEYVVALTDDSVVATVLPTGIYTHLLSSRLNGTVQSPIMPGDHKHVSVRFLGGGLSMIRPVVDSCALNEYVGGGVEYLSDDQFQWQTYPTRVDESHRAFLELTTKSDNVRWPDRPGMAGNDEALLQSPRSWFGVVDAVVHDCNEPPQAELGHLLRLFDAPEPKDLSDVVSIFRDVCTDAVAGWKAGITTDEDVRWIHWMLSVELLPNSMQRNPDLDRLVRKYRDAERKVPLPRVVAGMADHGTGFASPLLVRGNPVTPGPLEPRRYLEVVTGTRRPFDSRGSGRLELAELIASAKNPLTARVMVNRVWHHLFGAGLVRTPDDFGRLGERPSHPELLDYLASGFVNNGWSVKRLIRRIVTSRTFRQSSVSTAQSTDVDPENRLLHHFPVRRLEAEAIRDTILAVTGSMNRTQFGPGIQPFRPEPKEHRKLFSGPLDGNGRRSVYLKITRMEGPRFLELFDMPDQTATRGRRDRTNVPAQALALLNDPFVIEQSEIWGKVLAAREDVSVVDRINHLFVQSLARSADCSEQNRMLGFVNQLADLHGVTPENILSSSAIWQDVAHAMLNMKELVYVR
ncbi:MAG: PSD1 and planctomycete cytochrome C domain-containing protein [Fuerstiella sp.]|nr:PSD1 and planctomycete cytochrome C domain-containing protein [Fuerstiella sp.]